MKILDIETQILEANALGHSSFTPETTARQLTTEDTMVALT